MAEQKWPKKAGEKKQAAAESRPFDKRLLLALIAIAALAIVLAIIMLPQNSGQLPAGATVSFKATANGEAFLDSTAIVPKGTNAFDAMQEIADVEFQDFGAMGVMVEAINGVKPEQNEFWKLFVNGEESMSGISGITIEEDIAIEWKIESIESYTG